jgi:hypothetical protein
MDSPAFSRQLNLSAERLRILGELWDEANKGTYDAVSRLRTIAETTSLMSEIFHEVTTALEDVATSLETSHGQVPGGIPTLPKTIQP